LSVFSPFLELRVSLACDRNITDKGNYFVEYLHS
jgi:hypothetical protein